MELSEVSRIVGKTPHMSVPQAERMTRFIRENGIEDVLELGFAHGVSTCYMAAALPAGRGSVVSIDLEEARGREPNADALLSRTGLGSRVTVHYEPSSYLWRLMKLLEEDPMPRFDLCYVDGAHNWYVDGFAFFLADRLLRPGGWMIFDDLDWTYGTSPALRDAPAVLAMPAEERDTPQVRKVYELLVRTHPSYDRFEVDGAWAFAHKAADGAAAGLPRVETVHYHREAKSLLARALRRLRG